jgi:hypothetical protein
MSSISILPNVGDYFQAPDVLTLVKFLKDNMEEEECSRVCLETMLNISADVLSSAAESLVPCLLQTLRGRYFWCRLYALQLLTKLHDASNGVVQQLLLLHPNAIAALVDILKDNSYDGVIRNEALILLSLLTATQEEICKIFAFEGCFEVLLWIINSELGGLRNAGIVACDCLSIVHNMMRGNKATQLYFIETGCVTGLRDVLRGELDGSESVTNGLSSCMSILSTLMKGNPDATRRAAVSSQLLITLLELSQAKGEFLRAAIESMRCLTSLLVSPVPKQGTTIPPPTAPSIGIPLVSHKAFPGIVGVIVQPAGDAVLRHAAMCFVRELLASTDIQNQFSANLQWLQSICTHLAASPTHHSFDPYSAIILCNILEGNKEVKTRLVKDAKVIVGNSSVPVLDFIVKYLSDFTSAPVQNQGAIVHCKVLYRLLLTWLDDCPAAATAIKRDGLISAVVRPLSDPVGVLAATDPTIVWYYALGVLTVLQLYAVTKDEAWRSLLYHDITIPIAVSTFTALCESSEWTSAPSSCIASLNTSAYEAVFCGKMKRMHETVMSSMVESFLQGPPEQVKTSSVPTTYAECIEVVKERTLTQQGLFASVEESERNLKLLTSGSPVPSPVVVDVATLRRELDEQTEFFRVLQEEVTQRRLAREAKQGSVNEERSILQEAIANLDKDIEWSASEITWNEGQISEISVAVSAAVADLLRVRGAVAVSQLVSDGTLPRGVVPRTLLVASELAEAQNAHATVEDELARQLRDADDLLLLLSDVEEHSTRKIK